MRTCKSVDFPLEVRMSHPALVQRDSTHATQPEKVMSIVCSSLREQTNLVRSMFPAMINRLYHRHRLNKNIESAAPNGECKDTND